MKPEKKICKQCGKLSWIKNSRGVCVDCVYKNNHDGKTPYEVAKERGTAYIKKGAGKIVKNYKEKTGEREMFLGIWKERPHFCQNMNCLKFLGHIPKVQFFSHRKSKGAYPELRLDKSNVDLLCESCHHEWEFGDRNKIRFS